MAGGFPPMIAMMTQIAGFSTILFPFQTGPMLVMAILSIIILWPAQYLYWRLLGVM